MSSLPAEAVFAFDETGMLHIHASRADAVIEWEGVDVESGVVRFYDANGLSLAPKFSSPNRRGSIFGWFEWVESGIYQLVSADEDTASFASELNEARSLNVNKWFNSLELLKAELQANGVGRDLSGGARDSLRL